MRTLPEKAVITIEDDQTLADAVDMFKAHGISQMPCTSSGRLSGILTETDVLEMLVHGRRRDTKLAEIMVRKVSTVTAHENTSALPTIFERGEVAILVDADRQVQAILTKMDLIDYLSARARLASAR